MSFDLIFHKESDSTYNLTKSKLNSSLPNSELGNLIWYCCERKTKRTERSKCLGRPNTGSAPEWIYPLALMNIERGTLYGTLKTLSIITETKKVRNGLRRARLRLGSSEPGLLTLYLTIPYWKSWGGSEGWINQLSYKFTIWTYRP
jgi:hypothetical protein